MIQHGNGTFLGEGLCLIMKSHPLQVLWKTSLRLQSSDIQQIAGCGKLSLMDFTLLGVHITCYKNWRLIKDRLPTKSNLRRRQIEINDSICPFCRNLQEDAAHLFFNCNKSLPLWWESLSWTGIVGAFSIIPRHHFLQHQIGMNGGKRNNRWKCWWVALMWTIWQYRNKIIFSNKSFNATKLMDDALFLLWTWLQASEKDFTMHFNYWSTNLTIGFSVDQEGSLAVGY